MKIFAVLLFSSLFASGLARKSIVRDRSSSIKASVPVGVEKVEKESKPIIKWNVRNRNRASIEVSTPTGVEGADQVKTSAPKGFEDVEQKSKRSVRNRNQASIEASTPAGVEAIGDLYAIYAAGLASVFNEDMERTFLRVDTMLVGASTDAHGLTSEEATYFEYAFEAAFNAVAEVDGGVMMSGMDVKTNGAFDVDDIVELIVRGESQRDRGNGRLLLTSWFHTWSQDPANLFSLRLAFAALAAYAPTQAPTPSPTSWKSPYEIAADELPASVAVPATPRTDLKDYQSEDGTGNRMLEEEGLGESEYDEEVEDEDDDDCDEESYITDDDVSTDVSHNHVSYNHVSNNIASTDEVSGDVAAVDDGKDTAKQQGLENIMLFSSLALEELFERELCNRLRSSHITSFQTLENCLVVVY